MLTPYSSNGLGGPKKKFQAALGIDGDEPLQARGQALRAFMPALREGCEALLARAPGLLD